MMAGRSYSDEELTAYLDGEVSAELEQEMRSALAIDRGLARRLEAMSLPVEDLREVMDRLLKNAPAMPVQDVPDPERWWGRRASAAGWVVGLAACLAIGVFAGSVMFRPAPPGWQDVVASYQSLYVFETLNSVQSGSLAAVGKLAELSETFGLELSRATRDPEIEFKRAQLLGYKGAPLVQLAYLTADGDPVALCILKSAHIKSSDLEVEMREGMSSASWAADGLGFLVIGGQDNTAMTSFAERLRMVF